MPTIIKEMAPFLELAAMASLSTWTVCLAVGKGLCTPERAVALGLPGTVLGNLWFEALGWSAGPLFCGYAVLPGLVGTTFMLVLSAFLKRLYDDMEERKQAGGRLGYESWRLTALVHPPPQAPPAAGSRAGWWPGDHRHAG